MSMPALLEALPEVRAAAVADRSGRLLAHLAGTPAVGDRHAIATAAAIAELTGAGGVLGLHGLDLLLVRGRDRAAVTAVRPEGFLLVAVDPASATAALEKRLAGWRIPSGLGRDPRPLPASASSSALGSSSSLSGSAPGASGPDAVFSGNLGVFALPDLLDFLRSARRTGLLVCTAGDRVGTLRLRDGFLTAGGAPGTPRLGELLLRARQVSALALRAIDLPAGSDPDLCLAEALLGEGLVDHAAVRAAIQQQVTLAVRELVGWMDGQFVFTREAPEPPSDVLAVRVDPQAVLLQLFKEMDEASHGSGPPPADAALARAR